MPHVCHCIGCNIPIPEQLLMHREHWLSLPGALRRAVWAAYHPGQERTKVTTAAYRQAAARAIIWVAEQEGQKVPAVWRRMAGEEEG